jgi:hypothetical protein
MGKKTFKNQSDNDIKNMEKDPSLYEKFKIEAAKELGLFEKVKLLGWEMLTAQETGKIGALMKKK